MDTTWTSHVCPSDSQHLPPLPLLPPIPFHAMSSSSTFVPRRSARLAAKRGADTSNTWISQQPSQELLDARKQFVARLGTNWTCMDNFIDLHGVPTTIYHYLEDVEEAEDSNERAKITTDLYRYLIRNPLVLAVSPRFLETTKTKAAELVAASHKISDRRVREDFLAVFKDFAYVVAPPCAECLKVQASKH